MNKKSIIIAVLAIVVVVLLVVFGGGAKSPVSGKTVKIGAILPLSGDAAMMGQEMQKAFTYRINKINEAAGVDGTKFEVVYEDGKCSGSDAVTAFQKLTSIDGVKFILGGLCSSETMSIAPLAEQAGVLVLSPSSSNPDIEKLGEFIFSLSYSDKKTGEDLAKEMKGYKRIALINEQNEYNIGIRDALLENIKNYPTAVVVANETFPKGATDFRAVLEKVRQTDPDAILLNPNPGVTSQNLIRQLAEIKGWAGYKLFGQTAYLIDSGRAPAGDFAEGMIIIDAPNANSDALNAEKDLALQDLGGTFDNIGNYYTATSFDAPNLLLALIVKNGDDAVKVKDELSTGKFSGFIGDIQFDGHNFVQLNISGKYIVQGGKAVFQK